MRIRPVRFLPALVFIALPLVACDALKPKETSIDAGQPLATATATATTTAAATATDTTTQPVATLGGATPVAPTGTVHPVAHTDGGAVHTDGGTAPAATTTAPPFVIPGFDAGALKLPAGFDAGALKNPFGPH